MKALLLFTLILMGCTKAPPNYSPIEFKKMAEKGDSNMRIMVPKSFSEKLVECGDYTPPCRYGLIVIVKNVKMRALYYNDQKNALKAAKRIRGYVSRNWVLDDVTGEPVLERFAVKHLKAKKAE